LVAFPLRLQTNERPELTLAGVAPIRAPLMVGWVAVVFALAAAALLVRGVMRLSERRAAFVSSVTHELRTPLTTFRLYSDLLAEGMVRGEEKQGDYLRTMRSEADRLHHLVENVLAYSRIERGSARTRREQVALGDLLDRMRDRLGERVGQAGMEFLLDCGGDCRGALLETDVTAVEQIIFNLVDNACKYGRGTDGGTIRIHGSAAGRRAVVTVHDDGPGVPAGEGRRLFRPFHKSATEAAHSQPGVGLGLALSRRLAKALGGSLELANPGQPGAEFRLELPLG
jgi:signal transduction histidine kinase